jgi:drug/metabolite transporter (DMT)-like permease
LLNKSPVISVILAAVLFGLATPVIKVLLSEAQPLSLAAFLYLGAGGGILGFSLFRSFPNIIPKFSPDSYKWLAGTMIAGGVIAPAIQFSALTITPASTASLLLNFEIIATAGIAWGIFHERVSRKLVLAIILILSGSVVLSIDKSPVWGFSLGALGIICSCVFWGLDNNMMGKVPLKDPYAVVMLKGLAGGCILLIASLFLTPLPGLELIIVIMLTGFSTFGLGLVLLITSLRSLGAARTGAYFATAPFVGVFSSLFLFHETPGLQLLISLPLFATGVIFLISEQGTGPGEQLQHLIRNIITIPPVLLIRERSARLSHTVQVKIHNF